MKISLNQVEVFCLTAQEKWPIQIQLHLQPQQPQQQPLPQQQQPRLQQHRQVINQYYNYVESFIQIVITTQK